MTFSVIVRRALSGQDGAIGVVMALFMSLSVGFCALAVDIGSLYLERRTLQGAADLAAMAAATDLDRAERAAAATLAANGFGSVASLSVIKGRYAMDRAVAHDERFEAGRQPYNAVRVHVATTGHLHFAKSFMGEPEISVSALGTADALATFSVGSRLASVRDGLANALLGALLGGNVSLSAMDYQALLQANVKLDGLLNALASEVGITAGTYSDVLDGTVSVGSLLNAAATVAAAEGQSSAAQALVKLKGQSAAAVAVPLRALVDLGPLSQAAIGGAQTGLGADVNVMTLVSTAASLANGRNQVAVNLGASVPGLLSLRLDVAIGEAAQHSGWVAVGQAGATVRTAQTRLRLVAEVGGSGLLAGVRIRLPVYIELAEAEGRLASLTCPLAGASEAVVAARPAVVRAWIGDVAPAGLSSFGSSPHVAPGVIVQAPLVSVNASAYAAMTNAAATDLSFSKSDIDARAVKTAEVRDFTSSLVGSLLQTANLQVNVLGLGLGLGSVSAITSLVMSALTPVTATLDSLLVPLLDLLGVHLGEVDVQVNGLRCGGAVLAG